MGHRRLNARVATAAGEALARQGFVTPVDVCLGLGWLHASNVDDWRQAMTLAVVASVRHENTDYDSLLMAGVSREEARDRIRPTVDRVLASWS